MDSEIDYTKQGNTREYKGNGGKLVFLCVQLCILQIIAEYLY